MNKIQFISDLWDVLSGNTEYITLEQFKEKYDRLFVECDDHILLLDEEDNSEWHLEVRRVNK